MLSPRPQTLSSTPTRPMTPPAPATSSSSDEGGVPTHCSVDSGLGGIEGSPPRIEKERGGRRSWAVMEGEGEEGERRSIVIVVQEDAVPATREVKEEDFKIPESWGSNFWITVEDPMTKVIFYANPSTGEAAWDPPLGVYLLPLSPTGQWWELMDQERSIPYYFHTLTGNTTWVRPGGGVLVVPFWSIQNSANALSKRLSASLASPSAQQPSSTTPPTSPPQASRGVTFASTSTSTSPAAVSSTSSPHPRNSLSHRTSSRALPPLSEAVETRTNSSSSTTSPSASRSFSTPQSASHSSPRSKPKRPPLPPAAASHARTRSSSIDQLEAVLGPRIAASPPQPQPQPHKPPAKRRQTSREDVGLPVEDKLAALSMSPLRERPTGKPIFVDPSTKRFSTGDHHVLPSELSAQIQAFAVEDFAKRYFSTRTRTRGVLFRRKVPLGELVGWQKAALCAPLLVLPRALHRDAVRSFKVVQRVMGDRDPAGSGSGSVLEEERWLLGVGVAQPEIRDEVYSQITKQLTRNPNPESVFKGWQLLCVALSCFPPSVNLHAHMRGFLAEHTTQTAGRVDVMARFCLQRLGVIVKRGARGKGPTAQEIESLSDAAFNPSVFSASLPTIMGLQQSTYPYKQVPIVAPFLADGILALGGLRAEGIFRVPGDMDLVSELKVRINRGQYHLANIDDVHVPASLFKLWLRELEEPVFPARVYNACVAAAEQPAEAVRIVREGLPEINRRVVLFVISFLQLFCKDRVVQETKMTVANLAMIFAPNLLRCNSEEMSVVFNNARFEQMFVATLLKHLDCSTADPGYAPVHPDVTTTTTNGDHS